MERIREWMGSKQAKTMSLAALCAAGLVLVFVLVFALLARPGANETRWLYDAAAAASPEAGLSVRAELSSDDAPARAVFLPVTGMEKCDRALEAAVKADAEEFDRRAAGDAQKGAELNIRFELYRFDKSLLFVKFETDSSFAPRRGYHTVACDLANGETLPLSAFFRENSAWKEKLAEMTAQALAGENEETPEMRAAAAAFDETAFYADGETLFVFVPEWENGTWAEIRLKRLYGMTELGFPEPEQKAQAPGGEEEETLSAGQETSRREDAAQTGEKTVFLAFADSLAGGKTRDVLAVLREQGAKATFFPVGLCMPFEADPLRQIIADGHAVGGHTWTHAKFSSLTPAELAEQLSREKSAILSAGGSAPTVFYPPYGAFESRTRTLGGMEVIRADIKPDTAIYADEAALTALVTESIRPGDVILLDEKDENCAAAAGTILRALGGMGYSFTTLS